MQIFKFNSILKPVLWGGDKLLVLKKLPNSDVPIGESWEISAMPGRESVVANGPDEGLSLTQLIRRYGAALLGEDVYRRFGDRFPLLIKFIDAHRDLSIQVHPSDEQAMRIHGSPGKTEMWYIVQTDAGASIRVGFNKMLTCEEFDRRLADGTILDVINEDPSAPGDVFYIPSGQIHCIGAGNLLVEIQQSSDITYRVFDYNRRDAFGNTRELHTDLAREALDFEPFNGHVTEFTPAQQGMCQLLKKPCFNVSKVDVDGNFSFVWNSPSSFVVLICLEGQAELKADGLEPAAFGQGETVLIPAKAEWFELHGKARALLVTIPQQE